MSSSYGFAQSLGSLPVRCSLLVPFHNVAAAHFLAILAVEVLVTLDPITQNGAVAIGKS